MSLVVKMRDNEKYEEKVETVGGTGVTAMYDDSIWVGKGTRVDNDKYDLKERMDC